MSQSREQNVETLSFLTSDRVWTYLMAGIVPLWLVLCPLMFTNGLVCPALLLIFSESLF